MTPNRNDFVILNKKLDKYAGFLEMNHGISFPKELKVEDRRRLGFYIFVLEHVCEESDILKLSDYIVDGEFNKRIFDIDINDHGVDAIFIDEENRVLKLFNFKYRVNFDPNRTQSLNDGFVSAKFLNLAIHGEKEEYKKFPDKFREKVERVHDILTSPNEEWKVELYQVSNEAKEVIDLSGELRYFADNYGIEIIPLALPTIVEYMSIRPEPISAKIILESQAVMSYSESEKASAKSFIVRMKCSELLRITCDSKELRDQVSLESSEPLRNVYLEFGVLFDNVRGFVMKSKYNENIAKTLKQSPKKFFMYNNGITLVANSINSKELPGKKALRLEINGFQVVNGGQTLRTIHEFNKKDGDNVENYLYDAEVLVRIFMPDSETDEKHKIAEYTNSQNSINPADLKSLASEQIEIERFLHEHDIAYVRKSGDTGPDNEKIYKYTIHMKTFGQLLMAMSGSPEKATNSLKDIFLGDYERLFVTDFKLDDAPALIEKYYRIIKRYKDKKIKGNQLKYFYACYFSSVADGLDEGVVIDLLENNLSDYLKENQTTAIKALGSGKFKSYFQKIIENRSNNYA